MSQNVDLVRSIYAAWERGDYRSAEWAHPEIEYVNADGPDRGTHVGLAGMAESWRRLLSVWSEFATEADEYIDLDDGRVLVLATFGGTARISGLDIRDGRSRGANVFEISDGKVRRLTLYWDREHALADLGLKRQA
jgi:ketosteroid isomerase-like protein